MKQTTKRLVSIFFSLLIIAVPVLAWLNKDNIYDAARLHNYQVPAQVAQLADDTKMTSSSRRLFYVYHPQLQDKANFNISCSGGEKTIVLGCYVLRRGIYLYDVKDERLQGIVQVTAAHEMLHAAYDRLNSSDRKKVNGWLNEAYGQVTSKRIQDTIENYRKDGADISNELHSILGTEVRNLPSPLEEYYKRYFTDRSVVVSYSERYEAAFTERQTQAEQYLAQLNSLKAEINETNSQLEAERTSLDGQYNQLQNERAGTSDVNTFNARVRAFNAQVAGYNARVGRVSNLIDQHNAILEKYNALVVEEQQLYKAIDSRPGAIQSQ